VINEAFRTLVSAARKHYSTLKVIDGLPKELPKQEASQIVDKLLGDTKLKDIIVNYP